MLAGRPARPRNQAQESSLLLREEAAGFCPPGDLRAALTGRRRKWANLQIALQVFHHLEAGPDGILQRQGRQLVELGAAALVTERAAEDLAGPPPIGGSAGARHEHQRLSGAFAERSCTQAVDRLFTAAGAGALFDTSPLQRAFRDLHATSIHAASGSTTRRS